MTELELIKNHLSLPHKKWDSNIPTLREKLKQMGFYKLPVYKREEILLKAKNLKP